MYPEISIFFGKIPTFTLLAVCGICAMFFFAWLFIEPEKRSNGIAFIFPRIVISGLCGFGFAGIFDSIFKYIKYGEFKFYGITFYGGLLGGVLCLYLLLKFSKIDTVYATKEWFDRLIPGFILFHIFGRIGCFLGGCCYGKYSQSIFAIAFPDNEKNGIFHNGLKCLPTQLFEAIALIVILLIVLRCKNRFKIYLYCYAPTRFCLEFLRGDDRGNALFALSPSQMISLGIILVLLLLGIKKHIFSKTH